jgi:hypothetical protein
VPEKDESGASLVEFALVLPVFMMLLLGMFTGGLAYSRKLSVGQAVREGARYGATKPFTGTPSTDDPWFHSVTDLTIGSADGELAPNTSGRSICVAYVSTTVTRSLTRDFNDAAGGGTFGAGPCVSDGRTEPRIQVVAQRTSKLEALVFSRDLPLSSQAVARFEAG